MLGATAAHVFAASPDSPQGQVTPLQIESLDLFQAEQERLKKLLENKPKPYEDKFFDVNVVPPQTGSEPPAPDSEGFRTYSVETQIDALQSDGGLALRSTRNLGSRTEYRQETLNYGDFVLQIDARNGNSDAAGTVGPLGLVTERTSRRLTLRNLGFPVTTRLFADTSVGDISSEVTDALARSYRLSLGTARVRGLGTHLSDGSFDLRAGVGQRGRLSGAPYPGFQPSQGTLGWAGYSQRLSDNAYAGVQASHATGLSRSLSNAPIASLTDEVNAVASSLGSSGSLESLGTYKARLTVISSRTSNTLPGLRSTSHGVFIEAGLQNARFIHDFGVYTAAPDLWFGETQLPSDNRGAYWRMNASSLRMNWGLGLGIEDGNLSSQPNTNATRRLGVNANAQYRINQRDAIGGNMNWSLSRMRSGSPALPASGTDGLRNLTAGAFYHARLFSRLGLSRFRLTLHRSEVLVANGIPATGEEVEWEQDWIGGKFDTLRPEFATTIGLARDHSTGLTETQPTAGISLRLWPDADWSLGGGLRYTSRRGNLATSRGLSGTLTSEKTFAGGWHLGATVRLNQAVVNVIPSPEGAAQINRSSDRSASVYLRWDGTSGTAYEGVGLHRAGVPGGGSLEGVVFFDANRNGERDPGEAGVPGVEVFLDGRFRVTTDRNGRFDFPLVGSGRHQLTLTAETVPLPWGPTQDKGLPVEVPLRGHATAQIPVVRTSD